MLQLQQVATPSPKDNEVLIDVHAASLNPADWHIVRGDPFVVRLAVGGLRRPRYPILGADVAGRIEAIGNNVKELHPGDEVFGDLSWTGRGACAEYVCATEDALVVKPAGIGFEAAAATPLAAITALQALRDKGHVQPGHKVLINGAAGGVGTFAVQIAKSFGAEVTGVCSTRNVEMVRSLGADHVVDYTRDDATRSGQRYDLILDAAAYRSALDYRRVLSAKGSYLMVGGSMNRLFRIMLQGPVLSRTGSRQFGTFLAKANKKDLLAIKDLLEGGKVIPVVDRCYPLSETAEALRYLEQGHARGKVVITVKQAS